MPAAYLPLKLVAVPPLTALAFASLPGWARRMYGVPSTPLTDLAATAGLRAFQEGATRIPGQLLLPVVRRMQAARPAVPFHAAS